VGGAPARDRAQGAGLRVRAEPTGPGGRQFPPAAGGARRMIHLAAQRAVVRMLFDPEFARAVRQAPDEVLPALPPALRTQLAALDDRTLRVDRLRRLRALRTLAEEFKGATTLALAETRSLGFLEQFFSSAPFH